MSGECILVDGVAFRPQPEGRESVCLGKVEVGELRPIANVSEHIVNRHTHCFRLFLPGSPAQMWRPARDVDVARWQAVQHINEWLRWTELQRS